MGFYGLELWGNGKSNEQRDRARVDKNKPFLCSPLGLVGPATLARHLKVLNFYLALPFLTDFVTHF